MRQQGIGHSRAFDDWLSSAMMDPALSAAQRVARLTGWRRAPSASEAHPPGQAEHLLPALVVAGAGGESPATKLGVNEGGGPGGVTMSQFEFR